MLPAVVAIEVAIIKKDKYTPNDSILKNTAGYFHKSRIENDCCISIKNIFKKL